jgi:hypothetical protein
MITLLRADPWLGLGLGQLRPVWAVARTRAIHSSSTSVMASRYGKAWDGCDAPRSRLLARESTSLRLLACRAIARASLRTLDQVGFYDHGKKS